MRLSKPQKWVLLIGSVLLVGAILFPKQSSSDPDSAVRAGRKFLFSANKKIDSISMKDLADLKPDFGKMSLDVIVIAIATGVGVVVLGAFTMASKNR